MRISSMITPSASSGWQFNQHPNDNQAPIREQGNYSSIQIQAAGFDRTNTELAAQCHACGLRVSHWPSDIKPFALHAQLSPTCSFVLSLRPAPINTGLAASTTTRINDDPSRCQTKLSALVEVDSLKMARKRTFSHWPHRRKHLAASLIEAGFFCCNVGDRVICWYCHLICQGWRDASDDACVVHKALSPGCRYVTSMLMDPRVSERSEQTANSDSAAPVDEYLPDWSFIHDFMLKQAQLFRHRHPPKPKHAQQESEQMQVTTETDPGLILTYYNHHTIDMKYSLVLEGVQPYSVYEGTSCPINDAENSLRRLVAARLDLPISRSLLQRNFSLPVVRRCWEDQLRLKYDDFATDTDLWVACKILQKQGEHLQGRKENIAIVHPAMEEIRRSQQTDAQTQRQANLTQSENTTGVEAGMGDTAQYSRGDDACKSCTLAEHQLACIPCGHFCCYYSVQTAAQQYVG